MTTSSVGTTTSAAAQATINSGLGQIAENYNTFLSLLTTQLQNQDPTSPLDTNQFTSQLTQMTGVQQQLLTNQLLQQLIGQNGGGVTSAVDMIGKTATASGNVAMLQSGGATYQFNLPTAASSVTGTITDSNNDVIWSGPISTSGSGTQTFTWNGENQSGQAQTTGGLYTLTVKAVDSSNNAITVDNSLSGTVSG
ncbi:MAG: flagellar hook capping protein, partial [Caulobacteraceae bacterium]|nr:flagellar hook capping protein [Caulobacteraceae bacterium]